MFAFPKKDWGVLYKEVDLAWNFLAVPKIVSSVTVGHYKKVHYLTIFLWGSERDSVGSTKKYPILQCVWYVAGPL